MACPSSSLRARYLARLQSIETKLEYLDEAYDAAVQNSEVEEYRFNSGEGSQQTKRRKPEEIRKEIEALEASYDRYYRKLTGGGLTNLNLRRKRFSYGGVYGNR